MAFKYKYSKLYWFFKDFEWVKVYFSPFKFFLPKIYVGKTKIGVPYFLPRKWVNATPKKAIKATIDEMRGVREHNKKHPDYKKTVKTFSEIYDVNMKRSYAIPLKVGFSFCGLGWKTKWKATDFRHEWNPVWSFVFFGYQIALIFRPENDIHYWESYLFYHYATDKNKTVKERLEQAKKEFPCTWIRHSKEGEIKTDYWKLIVKNRYK